MADYFQEAVAVLKTAMQAEQQYQRGASEKGSEAAVLYGNGLELLEQAIGLERHAAIRPQLQQKATDVKKKIRALMRRVDADDVAATRARMAGQALDVATTRLDALGGAAEAPAPAPPAMATPPAPASAATTPGLTPLPGPGNRTASYATPSGGAEAPADSPRTAQRSAALQQASSAREGLFDAQAALAEAPTPSPAAALPSPQPSPMEFDDVSVAKRRAAAAEQRAAAAEQQLQQLDAALQQEQRRHEAAEQRALAAEQELAVAGARHAAEETRLTAVASEAEAEMESRL